MKSAALALLFSAVSTAAFAHPGVHHMEDGNAALSHFVSSPYHLGLAIIVGLAAIFIGSFYLRTKLTATKAAKSDES